MIFHGLDNHTPVTSGLVTLSKIWLYVFKLRKLRTLTNINEQEKSQSEISARKFTTQIVLHLFLTTTRSQSAVFKFDSDLGRATIENIKASKVDRVPLGIDKNVNLRVKNSAMYFHIYLVFLCPCVGLILCLRLTFKEMYRDMRHCTFPHNDRSKR